MFRTVLSFVASAGLALAASPSQAASIGASRGYLPPCPGINPDIQRPPRSNCLGILPEQCGADRVQHYVGRRLNDAVRDEIHRIAGDIVVRTYGERQPVTDDLRPDQLNVVYDAGRRIVKVDCY
jgi:hypothetical protein